MSRAGSLLVVHALGGLAAVGGAGGCFYVEPINQRPSADIVPANDDPVYRGDTVELSARGVDPEGHYLSYTWRAYACSDATASAGCDVEPFGDSVLEKFVFSVPLRRSAGAPTESVRVLLETKDELGATARPIQELVIPALDRAPTVRLAATSPYGSYVIGVPLTVYALVGDPDDGAAALDPLAWEVFGPAPGTFTSTDLPVVVAGDELQHGKQLTPMVEGDWQVRVTATDPLGAMTSETVPFHVAADAPPCLAQLQPIVPPVGAALPVTEPTLFRVPVVIDDLDVYPPVPGDPILGTPTFQWSIQGPGQPSHQLVGGATGNSFALDPGAYTPGDLVELRVEIFDRNATPIPCVDGEPTCSVISQPSCLQRQTWRVEIR